MRFYKNNSGIIFLFIGNQFFNLKTGLKVDITENMPYISCPFPKPVKGMKIIKGGKKHLTISDVDDYGVMFSTYDFHTPYHEYYYQWYNGFYKMDDKVKFESKYFKADLAKNGYLITNLENEHCGYVLKNEMKITALNVTQLKDFAKFAESLQKELNKKPSIEELIAQKATFRYTNLKGTTAFDFKLRLPSQTSRIYEVDFVDFPKMKGMNINTCINRDHFNAEFNAGAIYEVKQ